MRDMGLGIIGSQDITFRRKNRWMFSIPGIVGEEEEGNEIKMLPPLKSARPSIAIKEMEIRHLDEVVYYPGRQDWKTINLTLYHVQCDNHPIFDWMKKIYNPLDIEDPFKYGIDQFDENQFIKRTAEVFLFSGCGEVMEKWVYDCVWPTSIDWGELDMESSDIVYVDVTLRYARAYVEESF